MSSQPPIGVVDPAAYAPPVKERNQRAMVAVVAAAAAVLLGIGAFLTHRRGLEPEPPPAEVTFPPLGPSEGAILFAGDTFLGLSADPLMAKHGPSAPLVGLAPVFAGADASAVIVNHEGALTTRARFSGPNGRKHGYRGDPRAAQALADAGVTHASLANNHALDQGLDGLRDTARHLRAAGVQDFGWGETLDEALAPEVVQVGDTRVAIVGLLHPWPKYRKAGWGVTPNNAGLLFLEPAAIQAAVSRAHEVADLVVLYAHTGREYQGVHASQRVEASWAAQAGSDALVGHHSHVGQGWSLHEGMPVVWGLGNAAFGSSGRFSGDDGYGLLARMVVANGRIDRFELMVIQTDPATTGYRSRPAPRDVARQVLERLARQGPTPLEIQGDVAILRVPAP